MRIEAMNEIELRIYQMRVLTVLEKMQQQVMEDETFAEIYTVKLQPLLSEMNENDWFGTEGQLDPRGDFRDGMWDMWNTQEFPA